MFWYLAGSDRLDFIQYYLRDYEKSSDDGVTIFGAYGPRLLNMRGHINQFESTVSLLTRKPNTRQAVIQLFDAEDILEAHADIPCTTTLQFFLRDKKLDLTTTMRSNDAFKGLTHDVFAFTMIQEIIARTLGAEIGTYRHFASSLHLYQSDEKRAREFLDEAWQDIIEMPAMPEGDPWPTVRKVLALEADIRERRNFAAVMLPPYWADIVSLLQVWAVHTEPAHVADLKARMSTNVYDTYMDKWLPWPESH